MPYMFCLLFSDAFDTANKDLVCYDKNFDNSEIR